MELVREMGAFLISFCNIFFFFFLLPLQKKMLLKTCWSKDEDPFCRLLPLWRSLLFYLHVGIKNKVSVLKSRQVLFWSLCLSSGSNFQSAPGGATLAPPKLPHMICPTAFERSNGGLASPHSNAHGLSNQVLNKGWGHPPTPASVFGCGWERIFAQDDSIKLCLK